MSTTAAVAAPPGWDELLLAGRCHRLELVVYRQGSGSFGLGLDDNNLITEPRHPLERNDLVLACNGVSIVGSKLQDHMPSATASSMLLAILRLKPDTTVKDLISAGLKAGAKGSAIKDLLSPRTSGRKRNLVRPTPLMVPPPVAPKLAEDAGMLLQGRRRDGRASRRAAVAPYRSPKGSEGVPSLGGLGKPGSPSGLTPTMSGASLSVDDLLDQRGTTAAA